MTILGKATIAETEDLIKDYEFQVNQTVKAWSPMMGKDAALDADVATFVRRWTDTRDKTLNVLLAMKLASPLLAATIMTCEDQWLAIVRAFVAATTEQTRFGQAPYQRGDFRDILNRVSTLVGHPVDVDTGRPAATATDMDIEGLKKLDAAIKTGESLTPTLPTSTSLLKKVPWYVWGVAAVGVAGVGYSFYRTGQQVAAKAKRDTDYINHNMVNKFLPGYEG